MSTQWHYADRDQQQRGPVDATWLQAAYGRGEVNANTLVWREGLGSWQPLSSVAAELRIAMSAAMPPTPPTAARRTVAAAPSSGSPWVLVVVIVGVGLVAVLGILAAIAIPAYQDYVQRAKLSQALAKVAPVKLALTEFRFEHERCPSNDDEGFSPPASYAERELQSVNIGARANDATICTIELHFFGLRPAQDDSLEMIQADPEGEWRYRTTLPTRMLPASVRSQLEGER